MTPLSPKTFWRIAIAGSLLMSIVGPVRAVPSFARQTKLDCMTCHVSWPELTPGEFSFYRTSDGIFEFNGASRNYDGFARNARDNNTVYLWRGRCSDRCRNSVPGHTKGDEHERI
jgi:hypothetical protein